MKDWKKWAIGLLVVVLGLGYLQSQRYHYFSSDAVLVGRVDRLTGEVDVFMAYSGWQSMGKKP